MPRTSVRSSCSLKFTENFTRDKPRRCEVKYLTRQLCFALRFNTTLCENIILRLLQEIVGLMNLKVAERFADLREAKSYL